MLADLAAGMQYVSQKLVAVTAAAVAGAEQETAEMAWVLVQKVVVVQHFVEVYCVKV